MSFTPIKIFNILQGIACIVLASIVECDAIDNLIPVLFALGCCLVLSGLCQLYFHVELASLRSGVGLFVNIIYAATLTCIVWLAVLTWGESGRLWDGGKDCDGWLFSFVFLYTIVAAVEIGCILLFFRPLPVVEQREGGSIV